MKKRLYRTTPEHRGLRRYIWTWREWGQLLALALFAFVAVLWAQPWVAELWASMLSHAWPVLGLGAPEQVQVGIRHWGFFSWTHVETTLNAPLPSFGQWWGCVLLAVGSLIASLLLSREYLPMIYLMRVGVFLLLSSLLAHEFWTAAVNNNAGHLLNDLLDMGLYLMCFLPLIHALVLYIFPLAWGLKILATVLAVGFVVLSVPFQAGSLGLLALHGSSLMLVPAYMVGTFLPQLVVQLAIYGYFMSLTRSPHDV